VPTLLMQRAHDEVMAEDGPTLPGKPRRRTFTAEYKLAIVEAYPTWWTQLVDSDVRTSYYSPANDPPEVIGGEAGANGQRGRDKVAESGEGGESNSGVSHLIDVDSQRSACARAHVP
jgi:hypothetical protein